MKRVLFVFAILMLTTACLAQTGPTPPWEFRWGTAGDFVLYQTPYTAEGYIYDPSTYSWEHGTETGKSYFTVTADIEMYMSMNFDATDIYFHIADDGTEFFAEVDGELCSNNGQHLFVSSELDTKDLTNLFFVQDIFGRTKAWYENNGRTVPNPIPVEWYLKDHLDSDFRPGTYSQGGNAGQLWGVQWLIANGEPCCHPFTIKIVIKPEFHQPDGRYEMDPLVTVAPVL
ncbi:hypothetical protein JXB12_07265 [candidate division KSB1 bacterium]|nr:hypothetical protein [candidate division KSB1 bacterium]